MLSLREDQVRLLVEEKVRRNRVAHLAKLARSAWPEQADSLAGGDPSALEAVVEAGLERAREHGLEREECAERFVRVLLQTGRADFDESSDWASRILGWENADENFKLTALEKRAALELAKS